MERISRVCAGAMALCLFAPVGVAADQITVFAAASLRDALGTVASEYERETDGEVVLVFAASSSIARQVARGAPADVVLLADEEWANWLIGQGTVGTMIPFAGNQLVVAAREGDITGGDLEQIFGSSQIAMAQVEAVPAGRYAKAALVSLGLWDAIEPQVVQAANVRAALRFVERGEVPFGIGYASDLVALPDLQNVYRFAQGSHPVIVYSGAPLNASGEAFMTYLQSVAVQDILQDWGFAQLPDMP